MPRDSRTAQEAALVHGAFCGWASFSKSTLGEGVCMYMNGGGDRAVTQIRACSGTEASVWEPGDGVNSGPA